MAGTPDTLELDAQPDAAFHASSKQYLPSCLEKTQQDIIGRVEKWADDDNNKHIFWPKGMAVTREFTIARTVARMYHDSGRLDFPEAAKTAIEKAAAFSNFLSFGLFHQWKKLVLEPLSGLEKRLYPSPIILVIDALGECDDEDQIRLLVRCLTPQQQWKKFVCVFSSPADLISLSISGSPTLSSTHLKALSFTISNNLFSIRISCYFTDIISQKPDNDMG
ncbi:hypothetical protein BKA67DRAFT_657718 [Truncatella angustata]|uniref:Uncharacterized protein n=1 Tax=Truncatella angustata TaxID=152316 RepID=A0A9P8ZY94_9PEZI|nr:uncharacterized protein BKA67DRAFT_657718 [Truncatella angustata]KAH6655806.1 hypothetical protein BKA67DRAFT_657718 [Truncatella angustata]